MRSNDRRGFYLVGPDMDYNPSDFAFVNEAEALVNGRMSGTHEFFLEGREVPISIGLPPLCKTPALIAGADEDQLLDMYGLRKRYVSTRAKTLLSSIDPDAFEFAECVTTDGEGIPIEPYWMMDVIRMVDRFDEEHSSVVHFSDRFPDAPGNPYFLMLNDMHFPDVSAETHAFYLLRYTTRFIFDEVLAAAWRDAGLLGARFSPLQPPTEAEFEQHSSFDNYPYWTERGTGA